MAATPQTVVSTDAWEQALFDSESRYFEAGAESTPLLGGTFSLMPALAGLPAGCILHAVDPDALTGEGPGWLRSVEARFRAAGSRMCRLYLPAGTGQMNQWLLGAGYRPVRELGMVGELNDDPERTREGLSLVVVDDERGWRAKAAMYSAAGKGPDGHDIQDGLYAEMEREKCRSGYMRTYLFERDGEAVGTASLAIRDGFARLKNILVHPSARNQGVGRGMVYALKREASRAHAHRVGCFVSSKVALAVYRECGLRDMCFQTEWSRAL